MVLIKKMIDLYVRDYEKWTKEKKVNVAKRWIQELKTRQEFQDIDLRVKMVTEFIRTQEKKFARAFKLAQDLNLPPPAELTNSDIRIQFVEGPSLPRTAKERVDNACFYFYQLYHTLAPNLSTISLPSSCDFEDISIANSSSVTPVLRDDYRFSPAPQSSRSTSERPGPPKLTSPNPMYGFPPKPIFEGTFSTARRGLCQNDSSFNALFDESNSQKPQFIFQICNEGRAPIPIPVVSSKTRHSENTKINQRFCDCFRTLEVVDVNTDISKKGYIRLAPAVGDSSEIGTHCAHVDISINLRYEELQAFNKIREDWKQARKIGRELTLSKAQESQLRLLGVQIHDSQRSGNMDLEDESRAQEARITKMRAKFAGTHSAPYYMSINMDSNIHHFPSVRLTEDLAIIRRNLIFHPGHCTTTNSMNKLAEILSDTQLFMDQWYTRTDASITRKSLYRASIQIKRLCQSRIRLRASLYSSVPAHTKARSPIVRHSLRRKQRLENIDEKSILKSWFLANSDCPYPTIAEKAEIATATGMSIRAVTKWFVNARSRIQRGKRFVWFAALI